MPKDLFEESRKAQEVAARREWQKRFDARVEEVTRLRQRGEMPGQDPDEQRYIEFRRNTGQPLTPRHLEWRESLEQWNRENVIRNRDIENRRVELPGSGSRGLPSLEDAERVLYPPLGGPGPRRPEPLQPAYRTPDVLTNPNWPGLAPPPANMGFPARIPKPKPKPPPPGFNP